MRASQIHIKTDAMQFLFRRKTLPIGPIVRNKKPVGACEVDDHPLTAWYLPLIWMNGVNESEDYLSIQGYCCTDFGRHKIRPSSCELDWFNRKPNEKVFLES